MPAARAASLDFGRDVQPILSRGCFTCHGPDDKTRKAGLRLDRRDDAIQAAKSGRAAIVPGDLAASELVRRITTSDEDDHMPPEKSGRTLNVAQVEILKRWVAEGAEYRIHWAYQRPVRPPVPALRSDSGVLNPIDAFVRARLERESLNPAGPASREALIRRLSFDLTGLPPSVGEVDAFLADTQPDAFERVVERLLASLHHGERWARPWLDMARYADTNGYEADNRRTAWPWRDWVIRGFNADIPFDRFTIEQLAGDLLPEPTQDQRIATGFHRNTMTNTEGGTDDEEFRVAAIVDRLNTTFAVWMGTTLGCAQCHTHKYDPFTQTEYYRLLAIVNQTRDRGRTLDPTLSLPSSEQAAAKKSVEDQLAPLQKQLDTQTPELDAARDRWIASAETHGIPIGDGWRTLEPTAFSASNGVTLEKLPDASLFSGGELPDTSDYTIDFATPPGPLSALRVEALTDDRLPNGGPGRHEESDFTLTTLTAEIAGADGSTSKIAFNLAYADFEMGGYEARKAIDEDANSGWAVAAFEPANRRHRIAAFVASEPVEVPSGSRLRVVLRQQSSRAQHLLGRVRVSTAGTARLHFEAWAAIPADIRPCVIKPDWARDRRDSDALARHYRGLAPELADTRKQIEELKKKIPSDIPSTLVLEAVEQSRETHVMIRGNFLNPADKVEAGVPASLHPPASPSLDRLAFARWLVSRDNPLVARVTVNRIWAAYFGTGLVETSEDFGTQGEPPSHPDLLDWLAVEFMEPTVCVPGEPPPQPWSLKHLHRLIVHSATYRQTSGATRDLAERDPFNRVLARGPRLRLEAEMLRDNALAVGGILDLRIGGPSVMPYQPEGVWANPYSSDKWEQSKDGQQFRRGLYTFWRRTSPYPSFMAFDAPSREVCTERRPRSNTPVQALVTLNDPAFVAAANGFARAILEHGGTSSRDRMTYAFRRALTRPPTTAEAGRLLALLDLALKRFQADSTAADAFVSVGLPKPAPGVNIAELAAWQVVANALLNLDEALTKG